MSKSSTLTYHFRFPLYHVIKQLRVVIIDETTPNIWFDRPVLSTSLGLPFYRLRANGLFTIVASRELAERSNHKLRMNCVEGLTMTGHPGP